MKYILQFVLLICFTLPGAYGQIVQVPLTHNLVLKQHIKRFGDPGPKYLEKSGVNNTLPFLEDFTSPGPFPDPGFWEDDQAYINTGMGKNPPSYGVATFDGLDASGSPYGGGFGGSDTLTSRAFDLSGYSPSDNIFMSYFIQARGLGEKPDAPDILVLEFLDNTGTWVTIAEYPGLSGVPPGFIPEFSQHFHAITSGAYLHSNFKFRFRNFTSNSGFLDHWNLDYIEIDINRSANETTFNDIANVSVPPDILLTYSSMPFDQFVADIPGELQLSAGMDITNHFSTGKEINPRFITASEINTGAVILPPTNLGQVNFTGGQSLSLTDQLSFNDFDFGALPTSLGNAKIITEYFFETTGQNTGALKNDTARTTTHFRDYYAYDDGTAESSIGATGQGSQVAVMFHVNVADTIQAVQFHFQHFQGSVINQEFNIYVWKNDLESDPVMDLIFENPSYVDTINGFTQFNFDEPVFLESGDDFYIGWQQFTQTNSPILVGFDKNTPNANQYIFGNIGGGWQQFGPENQGALLIRPVMGYDLFVSNREIVQTSDYLHIFPNPVSESLNISLNQGQFGDYSYEIFDPLGRLTGNGVLQEKISVGHLSNGLHFLRITHIPSNSVMHHKFVKIDQ